MGYLDDLPDEVLEIVVEKTGLVWTTSDKLIINSISRRFNRLMSEPRFLRDVLVRKLTRGGAVFHLAKRGLMNAARTAVFRMLLDDDGDPPGFERDPDGLTAIHIASLWGHEDVVQILLDEGLVHVDSETTETPKGMSPLHMACRGGHVAVAKRLLDAGADVEARDEYHVTPLMIAAQDGHAELVRFLLDEGMADVDSWDSNNVTTLMKAVAWGRVDVVRLLVVDAKADVDAVDLWGNTALGTAALEDVDPAIFDILLNEGGANPDSGVDEVGDITALGLVTMYEDSVCVDTVRLLVEAGASIEAPFFEAQENGYDRVMRYLAGVYGGDVDVRDADGATALLRAARRGQDEVVRFLLTQGAHVDAVDYANETALICVAERGFEDIVRLLIDDGADPNVVRSDGSTALIAATAAHRTNVVRRLVSYAWTDPTIPHEHLGVTALEIAMQGLDDPIYGQDNASIVSLLGGP